MDLGHLSDAHIAEVIEQSAITPEVAAARGYRTLTGTTEDDVLLEQEGFTPYTRGREGLFPLLYIPMHRRNGEQAGCQIKPATPLVKLNREGVAKPRKYETPKGAPLCIDVPAFTRSRLDAENSPQETPLWITEGMKKVDALASQELASLGVSGVFNWRNGSGVLGDWEEIPLKGRTMVLCFDADAASNRLVQQAMKRLGTWLKSRGVADVKYIVVPATVNGTDVKGVDDYFAAGGDVAGLAAVATTQAPGTIAADASFTDAFLVEEAAEEALSGKYCWSSGLGWMAWTGKIWHEVSDVEPVEAIRQWASGRYDKALSEQAADKAANLTGKINGWRGVLSKSRLRALVDLARGMEQVQKDPGDFDCDPDLLTVTNGTVHLPTGTLRPFDPEDCITRTADAEYRPGFTHPKWDKALQAIQPENREWYQDRHGQALTGHPVPDHQLVIAYGSGANGKSTIVNTVRATMGGYGVVISDRVLMASPDAHPTELMDLRGARYAVLEETPEARHLNVQRLKTVLGTERIKARRIRQDPVEFLTTHSLFINTNYRPVVTETDHGTWRRLSLMPFPYTYRKTQAAVQGPLDRLGDSSLSYAHNDRHVRAAALAWMVEGAKRWYERDRMMMENPPAVEKETREWRAETDQILGFADECLRFDPEAFTPTSTMLQAFNDWAADRGHRPWNDKTFGSRFGSHDMVRNAKVTQGRKSVGGRQQRGWFGAGLGQGPGGAPEPEMDGGPFGGEPPAPAPVDDGRCMNCGGEGGGGTMDPDVWIPCTACNATGHSATDGKVIENDGRCPDCGGEGGGGHHEYPDEWTECETCEGHGRIKHSQGWFLPFDIESGDADAVFSAPRGQYVKLVGVGERISDWGNKTDQMAVRSGMRLPLVGVNNFLFDSIAMDWHHGVPVEQTITNGRDLRIAAFQNDPPTSYETSSGPGFKRYSMDALAQRYLGREGKSGLGEALAKEFGGWDHIPADDPRYVEYLREDLKVTAELDAAIPWDPYEEREARVCAITARATLSGFKVDVDGLSARAQELAERADAGRTMLAEEYGFPTTNQQGKAAAAPQRTKAGKAAFEEALKALDVPVGNWPRGADGSLSLSKENLATVHEWAQKQRPAAVPVIEAVQTMNGIRNNAANVLRHTHDGRVHPSFEPFQATGRWSILNPGLTVLKKGVADSERYFLVADEEETLVSIDLDQIDIRCVAAHSQDENLIALLNDPTRDFHNEISDMAFGDHEGGHRHAAKSLDLGWLYGRGIRGMVENTPGVTMEAAQRVDKSMRSRFGRVLEWQSEVRELGEGGVLLDNGFGRRLRVDQERAYTQSPAMLGQSTTRDLIAEGLLTLSATAPEILPMLRVIVHDEIVLSVPKRNAEEIARIAQAAMSREWAPAGASRPVRVTAGQGKPFVFGERWGQLYEK